MNTPINPTWNTWYFDALDTLFFRESRPMNSMNAELSSLFPPSAQTLTGAVRSVLAETSESVEGEVINWKDYHQQQQSHPLAALIGYGDDLANLSFSGVWVYKGEQQLYPAPSNIMQIMVRPTGKKEFEAKDAFFLTIANSDELTHCDLGHIRLPNIVNGTEDGDKTETNNKKNAQQLNKTLNNIWLTKTAFAAILNGKKPNPKDWFTIKDLLVEEPRIGIKRDNETRTVEQGMLYQTKHIRLAEDVQLAIDVAGIEPEQWKKLAPMLPSFTRLGGEGRIASITVKETASFMGAPNLNPKPKSKQQKIVLYLLSPLLIANNTPNNKQEWQPLPGFKRSEIGKQTVWEGTLEDINLTLHTAITAKAQQEGGWDLAKHQAKDIQSYIPAGSVFYCTTETEPDKVIKALHGKHIGEETRLGRGKIAIGLWV